ncbi:hypothetical protein LXG23DRAFT_33232 [Yarrowia lipolytica]|nr:hypothetical protein LXG23DRAFT_33232 [Yarrowia lipolytica]
MLQPQLELTTTKIILKLPGFPNESQHRKLQPPKSYCITKVISGAHTNTAKMALFTSLVGASGLGFATKFLSNKIRLKPAGYYPLGYVFSGVAWAGLGLVLHNVHQHSLEVLEKKKTALSEQRTE